MAKETYVYSDQNMKRIDDFDGNKESSSFSPVVLLPNDLQIDKNQ